MADNFKEMTTSIAHTLGTLRKEIPDAMEAFGNLAQSATKDGALNKKTKELIALAIGIAKGCEACIGFHVKALVKLGVTREEILETISMSVYMGGGPSLMYGTQALEAFEEFSS